MPAYRVSKLVTSVKRAEPTSDSFHRTLTSPVYEKEYAVFHSNIAFSHRIFFLLCFPRSSIPNESQWMY